MTAWIIFSVFILPLLLSEFSEIAPWAANRLLAWGASHLPNKELSERYREEWLAGIQDVPGKLTKLAKAISIVCYTVPALRRDASKASPQPGAIESLGRHSRRSANSWEGWLAISAATVLPTTFVVCVYSIPKGTLSWQGVHILLGRGQLLIPAIILCLESARRWMRTVQPRTRIVLSMRIIATLLSTISAIIGMTAFILSSTTALLPMVEKSIETITLSGLIIGLIFGVGATIMSRQAHDKDV
jgi:hypothetical protein